MLNYIDMISRRHKKGLILGACFGMQAFEMKAAMIRLGVQPTVVTYNSLVSACVKLGDASSRNSSTVSQVLAHFTLSVSCLIFAI